MVAVKDKTHTLSPDGDSASFKFRNEKADLKLTFKQYRQYTYTNIYIYICAHFQSGI